MLTYIEYVAPYVLALTIDKSGTYPDLNWNVPELEPLAWYLQWKLGEGSWMPRTTLGGEESNFTDPLVEIGTGIEVYWRIKYQTDEGYSDWSNEVWCLSSAEP